MADIKISQMPDATAPLAGTELFTVVQSNSNKKLEVSSVKSFVEQGDLAVTGALTVGANDSIVVKSDVTQAGTGANEVQNIVTISQTDYDNLTTPDANTLYIIE